MRIYCRSGCCRSDHAAMPDCGVMRFSVGSVSLLRLPPAVVRVTVLDGNLKNQLDRYGSSLRSPQAEPTRQSFFPLGPSSRPRHCPDAPGIGARDDWYKALYCRRRRSLRRTGAVGQHDGAADHGGEGLIEGHAADLPVVLAAVEADMPDANPTERLDVRRE
jgi:hypothetical protein